ncbi:MAG: ABC transporter permease, partial [Bacteroidales bacterium]|nr:ABC transporter permease [Bacteroidales bacterium]
MKERKTYLGRWFQDFKGICGHELKQIFSDWGVMLIFFVAGLAYPLLYNVVYLNGILNDTPVAVVDEAACSQSREFIRQIDATREVEVAYKCINMDEAQRLMQERKVKGIILFPRDFGDKLARMETAVLSVYADMSSFLYYKNALMATNFVMLDNIRSIQIERYEALGYTAQEASQLTQPLLYEENNPYNRAFSYNFFLVTAILLIIIQQTMFYGMSLLAGTQREKNNSFASLPDRLSGHGVGRVVLGRGMAYWLVYVAVGLY